MRARAPTPGPRSSRALFGALFGASLLLGTLLASSVAAGALAWLRDEPAALGAIAVQGAVRLASDEVANATGLRRGDSLAAFAEAGAEAALEERLAAHPWIRKAQVALLPTGTLIIEIEEREARAVVQDVAAPGGEAHASWHFVDLEGVAFAPVRPGEEAFAASLPALVRLAPDTAADPVADPALRTALELESHLASLALPGFALSEAPHRGIELQLPGAASGPGFVLRGRGADAEVILGNDDLAVLVDRLDRLERLLAAGLGELEVTASIDMRFAGQAVLRTASTSR
jgi:hypothetical protein